MDWEDLCDPSEPLFWLTFFLWPITIPLCIIAWLLN